jgi:Fe-S-cluster-containing hydrogenase component 2
MIARSRRASPVLVCKKCLKRCSKGARIRRELKRELKQRSAVRKEAPRLVSTTCFGICPKRAVVLASTRSLQRDEFILVSRQRDVQEALENLLPSGHTGSVD